MKQRRWTAGLGAAALLAGAAVANADAPTQRTQPAQPTQQTQQTAGVRAGTAAGGERAQEAVGFHDNIIARARENTAFRRVLYTGPRSQLVVMSIPPGGEIGRETHARVEQSIFVASGSAQADIAGRSFAMREGDVLVVPPGQEHNVRNAGNDALKLYTVYAPANHLPGRVHATAADAANDRENEAYGHRVR